MERSCSWEETIEKNGASLGLKSRVTYEKFITERGRTFGFTDEACSEARSDYILNCQLFMNEV